MAEYRVSVRNYHWSHQNTLVRSPILDLTVPLPTLIVQPLEGSNKQEPRVLSNPAELRDDIRGDIYEAEAHGVIIPTDTLIDKSPVWVPIHSYRCKENEVYVVNLATFEASNVPIAHICWVPGYKAPDGKLYTIVGAPRKQLRETRILVLAQQVGFPREAKFISIDPALLASYDEITQGQKKALFDIQLRYIRTRSSPPSMLLSNGYRVFSSPDRFGNNRRSLEEVLFEDLQVPRHTHSICSSQSSFDSSNDDDSLYDKPTYVSLVEAPKRPYTCGCKFPGLRPTYFDPNPSHRHGTDEECSLGAAHAKHCVFADHTPTVCVVFGPGEEHEHCIHPSEAIETEFKKVFGEDCFADVEVWYEDADRQMNHELFPMDLEPAFDDSPSLTYYSEIGADEQSTTITSETIDESDQDSYMNLEWYGSPEPKDMEI
ncbi:uncharacterized protein F4807DRAFT_340586 [Annulohypoxylon truncatum]|uniref:uncharacterized protein n=1 Tax=Annulohypoxylon truncatum TaxID=327061 RepID=UPI0020081149|nr:uncharacterized protein F4807DRAFT_340586 [Annulohypoxylon truncatum]KAI1212543.1 hypothetical protein F4807DRAFT_340586 [Annulohypoxylon truncatum]